MYDIGIDRIDPVMCRTVLVKEFGDRLVSFMIFNPDQSMVNNHFSEVS